MLTEMSRHLTGYLPEKRSDVITHWLLFDFLFTRLAVDKNFAALCKFTEDVELFSEET